MVLLKMKSKVISIRTNKEINAKTKGYN